MSLLGPKPRVLILRLGLGSWDRENLEQFSARCPVGCEKDTDLVKMDKESVFFTKDVQNGWLRNIYNGRQLKIIITHPFCKSKVFIRLRMPIKNNKSCK